VDCLRDGDKRSKFDEIYKARKAKEVAREKHDKERRKLADGKYL
jgi:hypothetical protein